MERNLPWLWLCFLGRDQFATKQKVTWEAFDGSWPILSRSWSFATSLHTKGARVSRGGRIFRGRWWWSQCLHVMLQCSQRLLWHCEFLKTFQLISRAKACKGRILFGLGYPRSRGCFEVPSKNAQAMYYWCKRWAFCMGSAAHFLRRILTRVSKKVIASEQLSGTGKCLAVVASRLRLLKLKPWEKTKRPWLCKMFQKQSN